MSESFAAIIGTLGAIAVAVASGLFARRKVLSGSAVDYAAIYQDLVRTLKQELAEERARREALEIEVSGLRDVCDETRKRMLRLEAFIRLNTDFDPEHINGP